MAILRSCIDCRALIPANRRRCVACERRREQLRGSPTARGYDGAYQRRRRELFAGGQAECELCGATSDLTADHVVPLVRGGYDSELRVLCRRCNSARGARR